MLSRFIGIAFCVALLLALFGCPKPPGVENGQGGPSAKNGTAGSAADTSAVKLDEFLPNQDYLQPKAINWLPFDKALFDKAKKDKKLIFVFESENFNPATRAFTDQIAGDPEVVKFINDNFLATWLDRDRNPGAIERYQAYQGGTPAVLLLHPSGPQVWTRLPWDQSKIMDWFKLISDRWTKDSSNYDTIATTAMTQFKMQMGLRADAVAKLLGSNIPADAYDKVLKEVTAGWIPDKKTFGTAPFVVLYEFLELLNDAAFRDNKDAQKLAGEYLDSLIERLSDPVENGFYTLAIGKDVGQINYAKRLDINSRLVTELCKYYLLTKDDKYKKAATGALGFIEKILGQKAGERIVAFHSAQIGDQAYFSANASARGGLPQPGIDPTIISQYNFMAIEALVWAHFTLDDKAGYLDEAMSVANNVIAHMKQGAVFARYADKELPTMHYLADQVWAGRALLTLYMATGRNEYKDAASEVLGGIKTEFWAAKGGLLDSEPDGPGLFAIPFWPQTEAAIAAMDELMLLQLSKKTGVEGSGQEHAALAKDYLSVFSMGYVPAQGVASQSADYAIAAREATSEPVDFHLLFAANAPKAEADAAVREVFTSLFPYRSMDVLRTGEDDARIGDLGFTTSVPVAVFMCQGPRCVPVSPGEVGKKLETIKRLLAEKGLAYGKEGAAAKDATKPAAQGTK